MFNSLSYLNFKSNLKKVLISTFLGLLFSTQLAAQSEDKLIQVASSSSASLSENINIYVQYEASQAYDLLVDVLDATSWYAGERIHLNYFPGQVPGPRVRTLELNMPDTMADLASAYIAYKLVPVGEPWNTAIDEIIEPLSIIDANSDNYFQVDGPHFNGRLVGPIGNHGSASTTVTSQRIFSKSGYGPSETATQLYLKSGEITIIPIDYSAGSVSQTTLVPPAEGGSLSQYIGALKAIQGNLRWIAEPYASEQEIADAEATKSYVQSIIDLLSPDEPQFVKAQSFSNVIFAPGNTVSINVDYNAHESSDILLSIFYGNWYHLNSVTKPVNVGSGSTKIDINVPSISNDIVEGKLSIKLIPRGGDWTQSVSEDNYDIRYSH